MSRPVIGFTQRIQLEWLEWTAQMALAGLSPDEIHEELQDRLRPIVSVGGDDNRSNRGKVVGNLLKIWVKSVKALRPFRDEGLALLQELPNEQHIALHWGMSMATYPFFGAVVEATGRLSDLQGGVSLAQVHRRVKEQYGQRTSIKRGMERVFYCLHDWGVLQTTEQAHVFTATRPLSIENPRLTSWLVEAAMISKGVQSVPAADAVKVPSLFPFSLATTNLKGDGRLELIYQGLDNEILMRAQSSNS